MLRRLVLHPLLLGAYPVLFLFSQNLDKQVTKGTIFGPLLVVLAGTTAVFLVLWFVTHNPQRAGLITSILVLLFFSFGHVQNALGADSLIGSDLVLLIVWVVLGMGGTVVVLRAKKGLGTATLVLNVLAIGFVVLNVIPILTKEFAGTPPINRPPPLVGLPDREDVAESAKRDIYYLIFDRYANGQILHEMFGFDNSPFLDELEEHGFYVAHDSRANYQKTAHSLASSLNMRYLNYLGARSEIDQDDYLPIYRMLKGQEVSRYLQSLGYRYYHLGSWWDPTHRNATAEVNYTLSAPSEFAQVLLESTLWPTLVRTFTDESTGAGPISRRYPPFQFEKLGTIEDDPRPTFTFAHVLLPHEPYVFGQNGPLAEPVNRTTDPDLYVDQLIYTNKQILPLVEDLLEGPDDQDPIVIIQSDEGPHWAELADIEWDTLPEDFDWFRATRDELRKKLFILNAYYFPEGTYEDLHQSITPVNTFRVLFNEYFGADLPLLEDRTYIWKDAENMYTFRDVTDRLR